MKKVAGIWIDHKKAVIATATDKGDEIKVIVSNVDKQLGRSTAPYEAQMIPADDRRERILKTKLNGYYDSVLASIQAVGGVLIFGPGEAKTELKKRIEKNKCKFEVIGVETADKMTDRQVSAKVRQHLAP